MFIKTAVGKMSKVRLLSMFTLSLSVAYPVLASNAENEHDNRTNKQLAYQLGLANKSNTYLTEQFAKLKGQFQVKQDQYSEEFQKRKEAEQSVALLKGQVATLNSSLNQSEARFAEKTLEKNSLEAAFAELNLQKLQADARIITISGELETAQGRVHELSQSLEELRLQLQQTADQLLQDKEDLQAELEEAQGQILTVEGRARSIQNVRESLESDLQEAEQDLRMLEARLESERAQHEQVLAAKIIELRQDAEARVKQAVLRDRLNQELLRPKKRKNNRDKENNSLENLQPLAKDKEEDVKTVKAAKALNKGYKFKPLQFANGDYVACFLGISGQAVYYALFPHGSDMPTIFSLFEMEMPELESVTIVDEASHSVLPQKKALEKLLESPFDYALNNGFDGIIKIMDTL